MKEPILYDRQLSVLCDRPGSLALEGLLLLLTGVSSTIDQSLQRLPLFDESNHGKTDQSKPRT